MKFIYLLLWPGTSLGVELPPWLKEITSMSEWPSEIPPYVHEEHHNLDAIPVVSLREYGLCQNADSSDVTCSFDCHNCSVPDDVISCSPLSQTFDDGPTEATPELLKYLKKKKTKTTFFLIGQNVIGFPEIVKQERREGHLLAVHTWSHRFLPSLSNAEVFAELQWTIWSINATAGVIPKYFRPPYGGVDNRIRSIARQLGLITVIWDKDTADWRLNDGTADSSELIKSFDNWLDTQQPSSTKSKWGWLGFGGKAPLSGLLLEHDLSADNVELAKHIKQRINSKQKTVAQCANLPPYQ